MASFAPGLSSIDLISRRAELGMHLVLVFTVAVGLYVLGMIVLALAAILGSMRGNRRLRKLEPEPRPGDY
jgi:hypothetical protein